jgi:hypothetical protein
MFLFCIVTGAIFPTMAWFMRFITKETRNAIDVLQWFLRLSPSFCFGFGLHNMVDRKFYQILYEEDDPRDALDIKLSGGDLLFLGIDAVLYMAIVFFLEKY